MSTEKKAPKSEKNTTTKKARKARSTTGRLFPRGVADNVLDRVIDAGIPVKLQTVEAILNSYFALLRDAMLDPESEGKYIIIGDMIRLNIKRRAGRVVRNPHDGSYAASGDRRSVRGKATLLFAKELDKLFKRSPSASVKEALAAKTGVSAADDDAPAAVAVPKKKKKAKKS